jgi:hypothetical protein
MSSDSEDEQFKRWWAKQMRKRKRRARHKEERLKHPVRPPPTKKLKGKDSDPWSYTASRFQTQREAFVVGCARKKVASNRWWHLKLTLYNERGFLLKYQSRIEKRLLIGIYSIQVPKMLVKCLRRAISFNGRYAVAEALLGELWSFVETPADIILRGRELLHDGETLGPSYCNIEDRLGTGKPVRSTSAGEMEAFIRTSRKGLVLTLPESKDALELLYEKRKGFTLYREFSQIVRQRKAQF